MKRNLLILCSLAALAISSCTQPAENESGQTPVPEQDYFQIQMFNYDQAYQEALLDSYFAQALLPALHRAGIEEVGVFKPIEELEEITNYILLLIPFRSLNQFKELPGLLKKDSVYQEVGSAYINAPHDQAPYTRIESFILRAFSATPKLMMPELSTPRKDRVYELRSYESATEKLHQLKVEMFNEGESALFQELKFNPVMFSEVLSSSHLPHLMYMVAHADTTAQRENWDAFGNHPEWHRMRDLERYQNTVSKITRYQMYPTEYSDY